MSDNDDDLDGNDGDGGDDANGPKALRAELKKTKLKLAELETENTKFKAEQKKTSVAEALKQHGASERLSRYYDGEGTSPDDVLAWLKENGSDFGWSDGQAEEDDENADEARRIGEASRMARPPAGGPRITREWIKTASREDLQKAGVL